MPHMKFVVSPENASSLQDKLAKFLKKLMNGLKLYEFNNYYVYRQYSRVYFLESQVNLCTILSLRD